MRLNLGELEFSDNRPDHGFSVGGALYLSVDDTYFPSESWYDMVWFDLKNWIPALVSFGHRHSDLCLMPFMDGSNAIRMERTNDGLIRVICLSENVSVIVKSEIDFTQFIRSVINCCGKYEKFLFEHSKNNQFAEEIRLLKTILDI